MDRDPLLPSIEHHIPSNLLGVNLQSAGRIRIIFYCLIPTCLQLLSYIIHMTADLTLCIQHYYIDKNPLYGGLTLLFVLLPAFIWFLLILLSPAQWSYTVQKYQRRKATNNRNKINVTTTTTTTSGINNTNNSMNNNCINNFNIDRSNNGSNDYSNRNSNVGCFRNFLQKFIKKENWIFFGKLLFNLILFPFVAIHRFSHKIFWSIEALFHENGTNERYDSITNACKSSKFQLYFFVQSYAQSAPQIILQLYIILRQDMFRNYETTNLQILSIVFSMINMAFITTSFQRFESQKIVGRYYPWATFDQLQNHKEKFSRAISATELSRQLSENNRNRPRKSDYFPENDKILQKLSLTSETMPSKLQEELNENSYNDQFHNDSNNDIDSDADNYNDDEKLKENYNNGNSRAHQKKNKKRNKENFLASSECIDLISSSSSTEDTIMNVTDDEKLKNCQQNNNNKNNQRTTSQTDEDENEDSTNDHLKQNRKVIENENENVFNGSIDLTNIKSSDTFLSVGKDFTIEKNQEQQLEEQQQQQLKKLKKNLLKQNNNNKNVLQLSDEDAIEHIGEEDIDPNELSQYQQYNNNNNNKSQQQQPPPKPRRSIKFSDEIDYDSPSDTELFDKPPKSPPPPPPPPSARTPSTKSFNSNRNSYTNPFDRLFSQDDNNNKRNSNPFKKLSIYKDMLIYNTEIYIMENVPHPPQFICDRIDSTTTTTTQKPTSPTSPTSPTIKSLEEIDKELKKITKSNQNKYKLEKYPSPKRYSMSTSDEPLPILQSSLSLSSSQNKNSSPDVFQEDVSKDTKLSSSFTRQNTNTYVSDDIDLPYNNTNLDENDDKTADTVDFFFLPKRGKSFHGIEQDDFFGKCTGFFGWFMFIYMRMISLSVFSVFYQFEFFYLILGHYLLMLIFLSIDIKNFKENIKKLPFYIFLSYVYIFIILEFKIRFKNIKLWYISYLILVMIENFTMTFLWKSQLDATSDDSWDGFIEEYELNSYWWFDFLYLTTWGSFLIFISCLIVYYLILKPKNVVLIEKE